MSTLEERVAQLETVLLSELPRELAGIWPDGWTHHRPVLLDATDRDVILELRTIQHPHGLRLELWRNGWQKEWEREVLIAGSRSDR